MFEETFTGKTQGGSAVRDVFITLQTTLYVYCVAVAYYSIKAVHAGVVIQKSLLSPIRRIVNLKNKYNQHKNQKYKKVKPN